MDYSKTLRNDLLLKQLVLNNIQNTLFFQKDFMELKVGYEFVEELDGTFEAYFRFLPYRLHPKNEKNPDYSDAPKSDDFWGDLVLKYSNFELAAFLRNSRLFAFYGMFRDIDFAKSYSPAQQVADEFAKVIEIWKHDFVGYRHGIYLAHLGANLDNTDAETLIPPYTFILQHELGHLAYNLFAKDCYESKVFTGDELDINSVISTANEVIQKNPCLAPTTTNLRDSWLEEYFCDVYAYRQGVRLLTQASHIPSYLVIIYGFLFSFILITINDLYRDAIGLEEAHSHPSPKQRLEFLNFYIDAVDTGKYVEEYQRTKAAISRAEEILSYLTNTWRTI